MFMTCQYNRCSYSLFHQRLVFFLSFAKVDIPILPALDKNRLKKGANTTVVMIITCFFLSREFIEFPSDPLFFLSKPHSMLSSQICEFTNCSNNK